MGIEDDINQTRAFTVNNESKPDTSFQDMLLALDLFFNDNNLIQKSRLSQRNIKGILQVEGLNKYLYAKWKIRNRILDEIVIRKYPLSIAESGKGRLEMIELVKGMNGGINEEQQYNRLQRYFKRDI